MHKNYYNISLNFKKKKDMKKRNILLLLMAVVVSVSSVFAQDQDAKRVKRQEKVKAMKIAFITSELSLTESEAQAFWPVYNKHEEEMKVLRLKHKDVRQKYKGKSIDEMTDGEAEEVLNSGMQLRDQKFALQKSFTADLKSVLPIKKVLKFHKAQRKFRRKLLKRMKGRNEGGKHKGGQHKNRDMQYDPVAD